MSRPAKYGRTIIVTPEGDEIIFNDVNLVGDVEEQILLQKCKQRVSSICVFI